MQSISPRPCLNCWKTRSTLAALGENARRKAKAYTLEAWQAQIAGHLRAAWGRDLHEPA